MTMRKMFFVVALVCAVMSCTKHDPFDKLNDNEEVWILSKFVEGDVQTISSEGVSFLANDTQFRTDESYYSHRQLNDAGLLKAVVKDEDGNCYRMPTAGELKMIFPRINYDDVQPGLNMSSILIFGWSPVQDDVFRTKETAYLDNKEDYSADTDGDVISGDSEFYYDEDYEDNNPDFFPIYALRFKGTSQYAAYRYDLIEVRQAVGNFGPTYGFRLKARWLKAADVTTTMDDLKKPSYWEGDCLELVFPITGYVGANGFIGGYDGRLLSSTLEKDYDDSYVPIVGIYTLWEAGMGVDYKSMSYKYALRLLKCKSDGKL